MDVNFRRARITHPNGVISPGRFIFRDEGEGKGVAAVWVESPGSAIRLLYASGSYTKSPTARTPNTFSSDDGEWTIQQLSGGCGCGGAKKHPTMAFTADQLLDPSFSSI